MSIKESIVKINYSIKPIEEREFKVGEYLKLHNWFDKLTDYNCDKLTFKELTRSKWEVHQVGTLYQNNPAIKVYHPDDGTWYLPKEAFIRWPSK